MQTGWLHHHMPLPVAYRLRHVGTCVYPKIQLSASSGYGSSGGFFHHSHAVQSTISGLTRHQLLLLVPIVWTLYCTDAHSHLQIFRISFESACRNAQQISPFYPATSFGPLPNFLDLKREQATLCEIVSVEVALLGLGDRYLRCRLEYEHGQI